MRTPALLPVAVAALLVLSGCSGPAGTDTGDSGLSPDEFPDASAIDDSVFDRHATALANASFTLTVESSEKMLVPALAENNSTYRNSTTRYLVEPGAGQYRSQHDGWYYSGLDDATVYSDGSTTHGLLRENDEWTVHEIRYPAFNESSDRYLWGEWFNDNEGKSRAFVAINASYEREGIETFQGVDVMRYEASGADALPDWIGDGNASSVFEEFSTTLLLDAEGVVRSYEYEYVYVDYHTPRVTREYTMSNVGNTDVEKPQWIANATAES